MLSDSDSLHIYQYPRDIGEVVPVGIVPITDIGLGLSFGGQRAAWDVTQTCEFA
jgi:hypothetical protein